jgi:hypothetical protein
MTLKVFDPLFIMTMLFQPSSNHNEIIFDKVPWFEFAKDVKRNRFSIKKNIKKNLDRGTNKNIIRSAFSGKKRSFWWIEGKWYGQGKVLENSFVPAINYVYFFYTAFSFIFGWNIDPLLHFANCWWFVKFKLTIMVLKYQAPRQDYCMYFGWNHVFPITTILKIFYVLKRGCLWQKM